MAETKINVLDLFSGAGGLGYGFEINDNYNVVCANELEKPISETYKANFPNTKMIVGDITDTNIKKQILEQFKEISCDLIIGGPPCVAYSNSGKRNSRDPRGHLFRDYVELVTNLKPKMFIMENVKGMLTIMHDKDDLTEEQKKLADAYYELEAQKIEMEQEKQSLSYKKRKGEEYTEDDEKEFNRLKTQIEKIKKLIKKKERSVNEFRINICDKIVSIFDNLGYQVEFKLLNSANYGVPQRRERVIFIGVQKSLGVNIEYPTQTHNPNGDDGLNKWVSVKEAINDLADIPENAKFSQIYTVHSNEFIGKIRKTQVGSSVNPKYSEAFYRCEPDKPSPTVKENHGAVFVHYEKNRVMTPRELARLQSFPDSFVFKGGKSSILKQLGNAVPCGLSMALEKSVRNMLK